MFHHFVLPFKKKYFVTNEENGIMYENVNDDIGNEIGKIVNKNVILN